MLVPRPAEHIGHIVAAEIHAATGRAHALDSGDHVFAARAVLQEHAECRLRLTRRALHILGSPECSLRSPGRARSRPSSGMRAYRRASDATASHDESAPACLRWDQSFLLLSCQFPVASSSAADFRSWSLATGYLCLPAALGHSRHVALERELAEAQAAQRQLAQVGARGRPHRLQRLRERTLNFGVFASLAILGGRGHRVLFSWMLAPAAGAY